MKQLTSAREGEGFASAPHLKTVRARSIASIAHDDAAVFGVVDRDRVLVGREDGALEATRRCVGCEVHAA